MYNNTDGLHGITTLSRTYNRISLIELPASLKGSNPLNSGENTCFLMSNTVNRIWSEVVTAAKFVVPVMGILVKNSRVSSFSTHLHIYCGNENKKTMPCRPCRCYDSSLILYYRAVNLKQVTSFMYQVNKGWINDDLLENVNTPPC